jgi:hypothetical protein
MAKLSMVVHLVCLVVHLSVVIFNKFIIMVLVPYIATFSRLICIWLPVFVGVIRGNYPGTTWDGEPTHAYLGGYKYQDVSVYHSGVDTQSYGETNCLLRRPFSGGNYGAGDICGSRCLTGNAFQIIASPDGSTRGCKYNCIILGRL